MNRVLLIAAALCALALPARAQVLQSGTVTSGHAAMWVAPGILGDAGTSAGVPNAPLNSIGIQNNGLCSAGITSGPVSQPYVQLCLGVSPTQNEAQLSVLGYGGQANLPLALNVPAGVDMPSWTTATRPSSPAAGIFGYNSSTQFPEFWNGSAWTTMGGGSIPVPLPQSEGGTGIAGSPFGTTAGTFAQGSAVRSLRVGNYYVNGSTGSDSNSCLSSGTPCLTIKHALDLARATDFDGADILLNIAAGTYNESLSIQGANTGESNNTSGSGYIELIGASAASTAISPSGTGCTADGGYGDAITVWHGARVVINHLTLTSACSSRSDVFVDFDGYVGLQGSDVIFGSSSADQIHVEHGYFQSNGFGYTLTGTATQAYGAFYGGAIVNGPTAITITCSSPTYTRFAAAEHDGEIVNTNVTLSGCGGTATNAYLIQSGGLIDTTGGTDLPGTSPGQIYGSGNYVDTGSSFGLTVPSADTGQTSISMGWQSLQAWNAGSAPSAAYGNTAFGYGALQGGTITSAAVELTAIGYHAGKSISSGNTGTFVGWQAGQAVNTGQSNTAVGASALYTNQSGIGNTAIGYSALGVETSSGSTAIGSQAGAATTGANNTIIGYQVAHTTLTTGFGNIIIGNSANADTPLSTTSNYFLIQGNGSTPIMSATGINSTPALTLYGTVTLNTLSTGTPSEYACFTSGGQLIASATAC